MTAYVSLLSISLVIFFSPFVLSSWVAPCITLHLNRRDGNDLLPGNDSRNPFLIGKKRISRVLI
jgi:hypothetical protein